VDIADTPYEKPDINEKRFDIICGLPSGLVYFFQDFQAIGS